MKFLNVSIAILLLAGLTFSSCDQDVLRIDGEGPIVTETLQVPDFRGINLEEGADVVITQGSVQEVVATGHGNIIDRLKTNVSGDVWDIDFENGRYGDYELTIYITVPDLEEVLLSGAGDIIVNDFTDQGNLDLSISGSGEIFLNQFDGPDYLDINISGSGSITAQNDIPSVKKTDIRISGSGNYFGFAVNTDECDVVIPGSGVCEVFVNDVLDVTISGSGMVYYKGNPSINQTITGSGTIVNAN